MKMFLFAHIKNANDITNFETNIQASSIEVFQEGDVYAKVIMNNQGTVLYDFGDTYAYIGTAPFGSLSSESVWKIKRIEFDANGNPITKKQSKPGVIWNNKSSITYY